jgi:hypothetical protein
MIAAESGSVAITASGAKSLAEIKNVELRFGDTLLLRLAGHESTIKLSQVVLGPFAGAMPGAVTIEAGAAGASLGKVEASEVSISGAASVAILGSQIGTNGMLKLEKSVVSATGDVVVESSNGTEVKENDMTSGTQILVASGAGGNCVAESNDFVAPLVSACP